MHTVVSDGKMTPEETKAYYQAHGYSVVAFTDHEVTVSHEDLADENFLPITSYEVAVNEAPRPGGFTFARTYHLNVFMPRADQTVSGVFNQDYVWQEHTVGYISDEQKKIHFPREYSVESVNALIRTANAEGCLVSYNHPFWSSQNRDDYSGLRGVWGVEIYNTGCVREGYPDTTVPLDDLLRAGERVFPLATDDAHSLPDCCGGYVMIRAEKLEYGTIFDALRRGDFYASTGPAIEELYIEDGKVHIRTSPAREITINSERRFAARRTDPSGQLREAVFDLSGYLNQLEQEGDAVRTEPYIRLTVADRDGGEAHTRAYFLSEI